MKKIYQIQIALKNFKPKIWRRILVPSDVSLSDFHKIIQTTMGWTNTHLHQFYKNGKHYMEQMEEDYMWDDRNQFDYIAMQLSDLLRYENEKISYEYDFGDGWNHEIVLEKILPFDDKEEYPVCIKGKMNCPLEDCGGVWGYADLLEVLKNPKHKEYEKLVDWIGDEHFDPEHFDKDEVNELLREKNYGCWEL
ncbi:MAG: plasmid pRiA4b ORF-3 family protein [Candidatus Cloacimonetes bacterium]|nr:plasmid pRiA4b ORF-3 family protein [Candidatus Cloacimonadota bacterium]